MNFYFFPPPFPFFLVPFLTSDPGEAAALIGEQSAGPPHGLSFPPPLLSFGDLFPRMLFRCRLQSRTIIETRSFQRLADQLFSLPLLFFILIFFNGVAPQVRENRLTYPMAATADCLPFFPPFLFSWGVSFPFPPLGPLETAND